MTSRSGRRLATGAEMSARGASSNEPRAAIDATIAAPGVRQTASVRAPTTASVSPGHLSTTVSTEPLIGRPCSQMKRGIAPQTPRSRPSVVKHAGLSHWMTKPASTYEFCCVTLAPTAEAEAARSTTSSLSTQAAPTTGGISRQHASAATAASGRALSCTSYSWPRSSSSDKAGRLARERGATTSAQQPPPAIVGSRAQRAPLVGSTSSLRSLAMQVIFGKVKLYSGS